MMIMLFEAVRRKNHKERPGSSEFGEPETRNLMWNNGVQQPCGQTSERQVAQTVNLQCLRRGQWATRIEPMGRTSQMMRNLQDNWYVK